jgi:rare lipoprotein A
MLPTRPIETRPTHRFMLLSALGSLALLAAWLLSGRPAHDTPQATLAPVQVPAPARPQVYRKPQPDSTGVARVGVASFYADEFAGREMANGRPMDPGGDNAASRTLPLGTTAKVTNLSTGKSALVKIQDRGPYAKGRLLDLSPATAQKIGITPHNGIARVRVAPIAVPQPDGSIKPGVAARDPEVVRLR